MLSGKVSPPGHDGATRFSGPGNIICFFMDDFVSLTNYPNLPEAGFFAHGGESGKFYCKQRESLWNNPARCLTKTKGSVAL
jgi:hypothetical protein